MFDPRRLRTARLEAGLTQEELARRARTSTRNVARWESGENEPRPLHVERLAEVLGRPPDFFVAVGSDPVLGTLLRSGCESFIDGFERRLKEALAA